MKWQIGAVKIIRIVELESTGGTRFLLPQATREAVLDIAWLRPHFADPEGRLKMSIHCFVVETPARRIVVDTGLGNDKQDRDFPQWNGLKGPFLDDLAAAGYPAGTIDTVLCTHLHVDHVGWNTRLIDGRWVPTFAGARYLMGRAEFDYWKARRDERGPLAHFDDSVQPVVDAGLVDFVDGGDRICEEVSLIATPGHSPGHLSVRIESGGEEAFLTGDLLHHPCQMARLDWSTTVDYDPKQAEHSRRGLFGRLAGTRAIAIGGHFANPGGGRVVRDGDAYRLEVDCVRAAGSL